MLRLSTRLIKLALLTAVIALAVVFSPLAGPDDGSVQKYGEFYPPTTGAVTVSVSGISETVQNSYVGSYFLTNGLVRFDTSSIADGASVTSAVLRLNILSMYYESGSTMGIEYVTGGFPISASSWSATPANTAAGYVLLANLLPAQLNYFSLSNLGSINKTGYTEFRLHVATVSTPTAQNMFTFGTVEYGASFAPQLTVNVSGGPKLIIIGE